MRSTSRLASVTLAILAVLLSAFATACGGSSSGASALEGTPWKLVNYAGAQGAGTIPDSVRAGITFANGNVSVLAPVNTASGPYTTSGSKGIKIGPLAATQMAGDAQLMTLEQAYLSALQQVTSYNVSGAQLKMTDDSGNIALTFVKGSPTAVPSASASK